MIRTVPVPSTDKPLEKEDFCILVFRRTGNLGESTGTVQSVFHCHNSTLLSCHHMGSETDVRYVVQHTYIISYCSNAQGRPSVVTCIFQYDSGRLFF